MYYSEDFKQRVENAYYPANEIITRLMDIGAIEVGIYLLNGAEHAQKYGTQKEFQEKRALYEEWERLRDSKRWVRLSKKAVLHVWKCDTAFFT